MAEPRRDQQNPAQHAVNLDQHGEEVAQRSSTTT